MKYQSVRLGDICTFNYGDGLKESNRIVGSIPVYGSNGIVGYHNKSLSSGETIIIGRKGSIGEIHMSNVPCWPIDTTYYIDQTKKPCNFTWLYYALSKIDLTRLNKSAAVPGLNRDDAYEQMIPLPPLPEQQRIAAILQKADRLRSLRRYARQLSDGYLQSVFLEMFGDPTTNPKGWKIIKLSEIGNLDRGKSKNRPRNAPFLFGGKYPFIQTGDIANSENYVTSYNQTYSELGLRQSKLWPKGTLCITIAANIAKTAILTFDACFPDSIVGFTPSSEIKTEYFQYWLSFIQKELEDKAPESAQKNINLEILRNLQIPLPPFDHQEKFAVFVSRFEKLRAIQKESERQTEMLFQSLLNMAFQ